MEDEDFQIPGEFWQTVSKKEFTAICLRGGELTPAQTKRAWRMAGRSGPAPHGVRLYFSREQVMKLWPPLQRH